MSLKPLFAFVWVACLISSSPFAQVFPDGKGFDRYGGYLAIEGTATGRFHLETIDGRHFLITPDGHGFLSLGVTHTIAIADPKHQRRDYLKEICGGDWDIANAELTENFRKWGYNSLGYGSHRSTRELLPYFAGCQPTGASLWRGKQIAFPDVFSDAWKKEAREILKRMLASYEVNPNLIGIYWTDMPAWDLKRAKRRNGMTWVDAIRALPEDAPGKMRYGRFLLENGADASDEDFIVLIAREVYSYLGPLTRELAPNTLIFGERYNGSALPWRVIQEALPWIDVVSVQPYASKFPTERFERLYQETGKPVMICDHQTSFNTPEHSNVMWLTMPDVVSVGRAHARYLKDAFSTPFLIGYNRCQYIDRYKPERKMLKQGLLRVDGKPYEELVESVEKNNWRIHERFINTPGGMK